MDNTIRCYECGDYWPTDGYHYLVMFHPLELIIPLETETRNKRNRRNTSKGVSPTVKDNTKGTKNDRNLHN